VAGPPSTTDEDAAPSEGGLADAPAVDAGPTGPTGPATPGDDGGSPSPTPDAAADVGDGGADATPVDAAPDAPVACGSPSGSYTGSCSNCTVTGGTLTCDCKTSSGSTSTSSLDLCACPNTALISNADGVLTCCGNPGGSYSSTCDECAITATVLACTCKTSNGGYISSSIALCSCQPPSQISNTNGALTCQ
jgi:hypothetical protein